MESVSAGEYLAYLSAVDAEGRESALAATSFGQSSKVTVKGQVIDNAQSFDKPNQPNLPLGLSILTEGISYGFTIAWSDVADLTGQRLNLFVDGVCIKVGINGNVASYYENRLATGTYEVEVRSQYTSNNVESFGLKKTVSIKADPGLTGKTPAELADPAYSEYKEPTTTAAAETTTTAAAETTTNTNAQTTTKKQPSQTTKESSVKVGKAVVKKAIKKKNAKKISLTLKRVKGATKYNVQIAKDKNFKKTIVTKTTKKLTYSVSNSKFKKAKKLYARAKAIVVKGEKTYQGKWSKPKQVKIKK